MQSTLGEFQETQSTEAFALQNSKLLKVSLNQITIQAKLGSMVAYQGEVSFEHAGSGGMGRLVKKAVTGEGQTLMKMTGTGEVFLADTAQEIHLLKLENDSITVNGANLLAFDSDIDWDIKKVEGAWGMMGGGLFNTAPLRHRLGGGPLRRPAGAAQHRRRPDLRRPPGGDHLVEQRQTSVKTDVKLKNFIGRGSGESIQMAFQGAGWVLVQPSEGRVVPTAGGGGRRRTARTLSAAEEPEGGASGAPAGAPCLHSFSW